MAKRKTPKSATPVAQTIPAEASPAPPSEISATPPLSVPDIMRILVGGSPAGAPAAIESTEIAQATSESDVAVEIADISAASPGLEVKTDAKAARAPWGTNGVYRRAASIAFAVAFGAAVGSLAPVAFESVTAAANADVVTADPTIALAAGLDKLTAELATLKAEGAEADRSVEARLTTLTERFEAAAKQQGELVARVAEIATTFAARPRTAAAVSQETTGSVEPRKPAIADGWTLWRVHNGRALVEGHGRLYDIVPGADLPGLGPVQRIQRSEGRWIVVTQNGIIVSRRS